MTKNEKNPVVEMTLSEIEDWVKWTRAHYVNMPGGAMQCLSNISQLCFNLQQILNVTYMRPLRKLRAVKEDE